MQYLMNNCTFDTPGIHSTESDLDFAMSLTHRNRHKLILRRVKESLLSLQSTDSSKISSQIRCFTFYEAFLLPATTACKFKVMSFTSFDRMRIPEICYCKLTISSCTSYGVDSKISIVSRAKGNKLTS